MSEASLLECQTTLRPMRSISQTCPSDAMDGMEKNHAALLVRSSSY